MKNLARSIAIFLITSYIDADYSYSRNTQLFCRSELARDGVSGDITAADTPSSERRPEQARSYKGFTAPAGN
ncbi:hypothetical protein EMIT0P253_160094 [Pseudomonas sp. IT-P253]